MFPGPATRREIADLRFQTRRQAVWQHNVEQAARNTLLLQRRQALITELDRQITPPPPPTPQTEIVYASEDELGSNRLGYRDQRKIVCATVTMV